MSEPQDRLVGLYIKGAPHSAYRIHEDGCSKEGNGSLTPCCSKAAANVRTLLEGIRSSKKLAVRIDEIRSLTGEEAEDAKIALPAFTPAGIFHGRRETDSPFRPAGIVSLDFDHLDDPAAFRDEAALIRPPDSRGKHILHAASCTIAAFITPSGNGVKILAHVSPLPRTPHEYKLAYAAAQSVYADMGEPDVGDDVTRLCFMSYDPSERINTKTWAIQWKGK